MKVFISHSVKGDPPSEEIARKLFVALEAHNFEPFLDLVRLEIGEDWEATLRSDIERSDAAILLLSKKAIAKSNWVAREIHLLQVREGNRPGFFIAPLLLGDVQAKDVSEGRLAHLDLTKRQFLHIADEPEWVDRVLTQLGRARRGEMEAYLHALQLQCERLPYRSLAATYSMPQLSEIYVRQFVAEERAGGNVDNPDGGGKRQPRPARIMLDVEVLLHEKENLVLEGGPGAGKSTLLCHLALATIQEWKEGRQHDYLPVLVTARSFAGRKGSFGTSLQVEIEESLGRLLLQPLSEGFFDRSPNRQARWLVLVDALDEILDNRELSTLISDLLGIVGRAEAPFRFVLTTRPIGLMPLFAERGFGVHHMLPFTATQVEDFAHKWFAGRNDGARVFLKNLAASRLRDLAAQPLLLTIAAVVFGESAVALNSRATLYREFVAIVLDREQQDRNTRGQIRRQWERIRGEEGARDADKIFNARRELLQRLAHYVREGGTDPLSAEALRFSRERGWVLLDEDPVEARSRMEDLLGRTALIAGMGDRQTFLHPTFADYLIAVELDAGSSGKTDQISECVNRWDEEGNREIVLFLLGLQSERKVQIDGWMQRIFSSGPKGVRFCGLAMAEGIALPELELDVIKGLLEQTRKYGLVELYERPNATDILGLLRGFESVRTGLIEIARGDVMYERVRDRTADALARLGCVEDLRDLSADPAVSATVRTRAAAHLGLYDAESAHRILVALALDRQTDGYVRIDAVGALWGIGFTRDAPSLAVHLCLDPDLSKNEHMRIRIAEIAGHIGRPEEALELLFRACHDPDVAMSRTFADEDLVKAISGLGQMRQLLEVRGETAWSRRIAESSVRWLYRRGEDDAGARIVAEILRESRETGKGGVYPTQIFTYVQDQPSLARIANDESVDEEFRKAAAKYLERIGYREKDDRPDRFPELRAVHAEQPGLFLRLRWRIERVAESVIRLMGRTHFALRGATDPLIRRLGTARYVNYLGRTACSPQASEDQRLDAVNRIIGLQDWNKAIECWRVMAADCTMSEIYRAHCAYLLYSADPAGEDWRNIADGSANVQGAEHYFELLGESEDQQAGARLISRIVASKGVDFEFKVHAIRSLRAWLDSTLAEELARNSSLKPWHRVLAVRQIPETGAELLSSLAHDEGVDHWARIEAVDQLGRYGRAHELLRLAEEGALDDRIRSYAIWWLGRLDDRTLKARLKVIAESVLSKRLRAAIDDASTFLTLRAGSPTPNQHAKSRN